MTRHSARASPALRALTESDPALAALALWCDHRDRDTGPAAETCGSTIYYAPAFDPLPRHEQTGLAAHHILHVALRHSDRLAQMQARFGPGCDAALYNIAADAIVNEALLLAGHALPRPALRLTGLLETALGIFAPAAEALADWDTDRLYIRLMQGGAGQDSASDRAKSYAATRAYDADVQPESAPRTTGDTPDPADWQSHVTRAMEAGRNAGRGIGLLGHRLADLPRPRTPWEVILRGLVTRAVTPLPRPSHRRPSGRWLAMEAEALRTGGPVPPFQPGMQRASPLPRIALALDSSSSVDDARLELFMAEVTGIARRTSAELHLLLFDDVVQAALRLDPAQWQHQLAGLTPPRGGGTSFAPALAAAAALRPSVIVVLTDLEGDPGPAPRGIPVIWAVPAGEVPRPPPFGHLLNLAQ